MKLKKHHQCYVAELPKCDFCSAVAKYDGKTVFGAWGFMCSMCFSKHGMGTGLGVGQELLVAEKVGK